MVVKKLLIVAEEKARIKKQNTAVSYNRKLFEETFECLSDPKNASVSELILDEYPEPKLPIGFEEFKSRIYNASDSCYGVRSHLEKSINMWGEEVEYMIITLYTL